MDVDDLQIGTNKVRWEKETVSYPISNSETSTWTGKVLHIDKLDDESYTLKFKYDGDTSNLVYEVDMYSYENGCMIPHGSIMVDVYKRQIIYVLGYDIELGEGENTLYKEYEKI